MTRHLTPKLLQVTVTYISWFSDFALILQGHLSLVVRKLVFGVSDQVTHKPGCTITQMVTGLKFRIYRKKRDCTIYVAKTKALISFAVTAKLICVFVFAYAKSRFSHDAAHLINEQDDSVGPNV